MPAIAPRKRGPRGPRLNYSRMLKLLSQKRPLLSYAEIAEKLGCSASSVSRFAALPPFQRKALAAK